MAETRSGANQPIEGLRREIDQLDRDFIALLAKRMELVREVSDAKRADPGTPVRDDERERKIFEVWAEEARRRGLSPYFVGRVLRELLNYSRRDQERLLDRDQSAVGPVAVRVGYQGMPGSYSDLAIGKHFAGRGVERLERLGFPGFAAVLDALEAEQVGYALLPIENTIAGSINGVYDLLSSRRVTVVGEEVWPVEHCLLGLPGARLEGLATIRSHPVALQQCTRFLRGLVGARLETYFDTAGAAQSVARELDASIGAIASEEAGRLWGLQVLRREVADQAVNLTRFLLVATRPEPIGDAAGAKTSLVMVVRHQAGALFECLRLFNDAGLSLTKLESRPLPEKPWAYRFFVDVLGHAAAEPLAGVLAALPRYTNHLKVLGSYGRAPETVGHAPAPAQSPTVSVPTEEVRGVPGDHRSVRLGTVEIGGPRFVLVAGPEEIGGRRQMLEAAAAVREAGGSVLFSPTLPPRREQRGFDARAFGHLLEAGKAFELPVLVEVHRPEDVAKVLERGAVPLIGARHMGSHALLHEVGTSHAPVVLERALGATARELLLAAEEVMAGGNHQIVLCERGIRTFETVTPATLDLAAVAWLRETSSLPVLVDPCRAAGRPELALPLALAAAAAGADGLVLETRVLAATAAALAPLLACLGRGL